MTTSRATSRRALAEGAAHLRPEETSPLMGGFVDGGSPNPEVPGVRFGTRVRRLAGVAPSPVSSGNTQRRRLDRGGDRRLDRALHTVALTRLGHDPRTRAHLARRTAEGHTRRETIRILERYTSRGLPRLLTATQPQPSAPLDGHGKPCANGS